MKKIGFIGTYDKIDMLTYVAKILTNCGKKILVIDSSITQKARYIIPAVNPISSYITDFEGIDFAIGFTNLEQIKQYLQIQTELPYDIILIDIDNPYNIEGFGLNEVEKNYFVTGTDVFTIRRGIQIASLIRNPIKMNKIVYSQYMTQEESNYIEYLSKESKVLWGDINIYFPIENGDLTVIAENQRQGKINLRKLSQDYKLGLLVLTKDIAEEISEAQIKKAMKYAEEGKK